MNKARITEQLLQAIWDCENAQSLNDNSFFQKNQEQVRKNIAQAAKAFSGSWIGYHANVYYRGLNAPSPGDHFSSEWGLMAEGWMYRTGPRNWLEHSREEILAAMKSNVDEGFEEKLSAVSGQAADVLREHLDSIRTIVEVLLKNEETPTLRRIYDDIIELKPDLTAQVVIDAMRPSGQFMTRDMTALSQGTIVPVHCMVHAAQVALLHPFTAFAKLAECCNRVLRYMALNDLLERKVMPVNSRVFIGHGRSALWRELKDFLQDRLHLAWEEFNRSPAAGVATSDRLQEMLDNSCFAFLVMTGEDQHANQSLHARENVVHEVGLFQGKLGFRRAIVVLEEGCTEFSNITGLSQIRFPTGNIGQRSGNPGLTGRREGEAL
jgi:predicted nucleotide-binding protein